MTVLIAAYGVCQGYVEALEVYITLSMKVWGERTNRRGIAFQNGLMSHHALTYHWCQDHHGNERAYEDIRWPWWWGQAQVHDSDKAVLFRKDPQHYSQFQSFSQTYPDKTDEKGKVTFGYVWPKDINANHPDQQTEIEREEKHARLEVALAEEENQAELQNTDSVDTTTTDRKQEIGHTARSKKRKLTEKQASDIQTQEQSEPPSNPSTLSPLVSTRTRSKSKTTSSINTKRRQTEGRA